MSKSFRIPLDLCAFDALTPGEKRTLMLRHHRREAVRAALQRDGNRSRHHRILAASLIKRGVCL